MARPTTRLPLRTAAMGAREPALLKSGVTMRGMHDWHQL
jgi:hypothetical protein